MKRVLEQVVVMLKFVPASVKMKQSWDEVKH